MKKRKIVTVSLVVLSVFLAWWFAKSGGSLILVQKLSSYPHLAAFLAGIGFSSLFTTAPATVALGTISSFFGVWPTAFFGGVGALLGDMALLKTMTSIAQSAKRPVAKVINPPRFLKLHRLRLILSHGPLKLILWATGAIVIASPLPDELGLALMGATRIPFWLLVCISFVFNMLGIAVIGLVTSSL